MREHKAQSAGHLLSGLIRKYNLEEEIFKCNLIERWSEIVGPELNNICKPVEYKEGILILKTKNSIWRQELGKKRKELLNSIKTKTKVNRIRAIELI